MIIRVWTLTLSRSINTQKNNLNNVMPFSLHTWSITHNYIHSADKHVCAQDCLNLPEGGGRALGVANDQSVPLVKFMTDIAIETNQ